MQQDWQYHHDVISTDEVLSFFPESIDGLFSLPVVLFGIHTTGERIYNETQIVSESYFLVAMADSVDERMKDSQSRFIKKEGYYFDELKHEYRELYGYEPVLVLRLCGRITCQSGNPMTITEFLRYADLNDFRNKGIAKAVFNSVSHKLRELGTEFIYVNHPYQKFQGGKGLIIAKYASPQLQEDIMKGFPDGFRRDYKSTYVEHRDFPFFVCLDPERHIKEVRYSHRNR